jgi:hypothetical protein
LGVVIVALYVPTTFAALPTTLIAACVADVYTPSAVSANHAPFAPAVSGRISGV